MFNRFTLALVLSSILSTGSIALENNHLENASSKDSSLKDNGDEIKSTLNDQQSIAVTIYNNDLALVKDTRKIKLKNGVNTLAIRDVSAQIRPETAFIKSITAAGSLSLLEQNFEFDLLTPQKLLEKHIGKTVGLVKVHPTTGVETVEQATVSSTNDGTVLKVGNRIVTGATGHIVFDDLPKNLRDRPTLVTLINNKGSTNQLIELNYLTGGLAWHADYVAQLNDAENKLDLSGLATITNASGASYNNTKLQFVAGDVNRVQERMNPMLKTMRMQESMAADASAPITQESLLEYHLYTMDRPITIAENQTKQFALFSANNVPVKKELVLTGADYYYQGQYGEIGKKLKVAVFIEFENKESSKLGMPLPKGILRVYKNDSQGNAQFVGENSINHTAKNAQVRLSLGEAFDITADKKQTDFKVLPNPQKNHSAFESAYEITLNNAKKQKITVIVQEPINGEWKILSESQAHTKVNSQLAEWKVEIPAESKTTLTYRAQVKY